MVVSIANLLNFIVIEQLLLLILVFIEWFALAVHGRFHGLRYPGEHGALALAVDFHFVELDFIFDD